MYHSTPLARLEPVPALGGALGRLQLLVHGDDLGREQDRVVH